MDKLLWAQIKTNLKKLLPLLTTPVGKVSSVVLLVVVAYVFGTCNKPDDYKTKMEAWKKTAESALANNKTVRAKVDTIKVVDKKLEAKAAAQTKEITVLNAHAATLKVQADAALALAKAEATKECPCVKALAAADGFKKQADSLQKSNIILEQRDTTRLVEISSLRVGISTLEVQNDSLVNVIKKVPEQKNKFLWIIPEPSRKTSFLLGIGGGAIAAVKVFR